MSRLLARFLAAVFAASSVLAAQEQPPFVLVVMDPMAAPLACPCVEGYAQRKYEELGAYLESKLDRKVEVVFSESLAGALKRQTDGKADLIIGKHSVVLAGAKSAKLNVQPIASLTDKEGVTTQTGLFVVRSADPAKDVAALKGYRILFGPAECDEKSAAPIRLLEKSGVKVPEERETSPACSDAATKLLELKDVKAAAVISSYAQPLLEGCGTIDAGALRVVGETEPVPFITAFVNKGIGDELRGRIKAALLAVGEDAELLAALETKSGFVKCDAEAAVKKKLAYEPAADAQAVWPGWRGPGRDGRALWLPDRLPGKLHTVWKQPLNSRGLAGVAAERSVVVVADRDAGDTDDVFRGLETADGKELWQVSYPAPGELDYGNSPRATPLIEDGVVYLLGAHGHLNAVELESGLVLWTKDLAVAFEAPPPTWGYCGSPLLADGKLIVQPGGADASLVALDPQTGEVTWRSPGRPSGYSSFIVATFSGVRQLVGYDAETLGGWDLATGNRLWELRPPNKGDFNVPTPIQWGERLVVATENNGTRVYAFDGEGRIRPEPVAAHADLAPDTASHVVLGRRVFGCWNALFCLDLENGLRPIWSVEDHGFDDHASLIVSQDRLLVTTMQGELLLFDATADEVKELGRQRLFADGTEVYSHPALVGSRLYVRNTDSILCVELKGQ